MPDFILPNGKIQVACLIKLLLRTKHNIDLKESIAMIDSFVELKTQELS